MTTRHAKVWLKTLEVACERARDAVGPERFHEVAMAFAAKFEKELPANHPLMEQLREHRAGDGEGWKSA